MKGVKAKERHGTAQHVRCIGERPCRFPRPAGERMRLSGHAKRGEQEGAEVESWRVVGWKGTAAHQLPNSSQSVAALAEGACRDERSTGTSQSRRRLFCPGCNVSGGDPAARGGSSRWKCRRPAARAASASGDSTSQRRCFTALMTAVEHSSTDMAGQQRPRGLLR